MLKIYQAYSTGDEIKIEDKIEFKHVQFNTRLNAFGYVKSGNVSVSSAN